MDLKNFKDFVINYKPYEWEIDKTDQRWFAKGKHNLIYSFGRFSKVFNFLHKIKKDLSSSPKIIDVGAYPGHMIKLSKHIFKDLSEYSAVGLGLSDEFVKEVKKENVTCVDTEVDPAFPEPSKISDWNIKDNDLCIFLDTIEHLVDPTYCLDQINKSLKLNGHLLITTDNITNWLYILYMLRKGKSPNVHPISSSKVYRGNWRPHHKEYSKDELIFFLKYSGFELVEHEYFNRKQGEYFIDQENRIIKKHNLKWGLKNIIFEIIKNVGFLVPHLRNHHILLARKVKDIHAVKSIRKTTKDRSEWLRMRIETIGY